MSTKSKVLITLTSLTLDNGTIRFSVTDGQATVHGTTGHLRLENDFLAVVKELIQGNPTYKKEDINFAVGDWPERSIRFAIDSDLVNAMVERHQENSDVMSISKLDEHFINLFDNVNGNKAASDSVGIAQLVKGIQTGEFQICEDTNPITDLVEVMLKHDAWDVNNQGVKVIEGKVTEFGEDIEFTICSAVGNCFVEGRIGKLGVRIFKAQNVQVYIGWGKDFPARPEVFQVYQEEAILQRLYDAVEISANSPA